MKHPQNVLRAGVRAGRLAVLLGAFVLLGAECQEGADWVHGLFFGTELPRYGNEREEELSFFERLWREKIQTEALPENEYPGVTLPTFSTETEGGPSEMRLGTSAEFTVEGRGATVTTPSGAEKGTQGSPAPTERLPGIYGETRRMRVITYQGHYVEEGQVVTKTEAGCPTPHWHAKNRSQVRTVEGIEFPDTGGCAFGKVSENPVKEVDIPLNIINSARAVN